MSQRCFETGKCRTWNHTCLSMYYPPTPAAPKHNSQAGTQTHMDTRAGIFHTPELLAAAGHGLGWVRHPGSNPRTHSHALGLAAEKAKESPGQGGGEQENGGDIAAPPEEEEEEDGSWLCALGLNQVRKKPTAQVELFPISSSSPAHTQPSPAQDPDWFLSFLVQPSQSKFHLMAGSCYSSQHEGVLLWFF